MKIPPMKDMAIDKEPEMSMGMPYALGEMQSKYPYGLQITLCDAELEKLGLEGDCEIGDLIHLFCMAQVTGISTQEDTDGEKCRVSLQIKFMTAEVEDQEDEDEDDEEPVRKVKKSYLHKK